MKRRDDDYRRPRSAYQQGQDLAPWLLVLLVIVGVLAGCDWLIRLVSG